MMRSVLARTHILTWLILSALFYFNQVLSNKGKSVAIENRNLKTFPEKQFPEIPSHGRSGHSLEIRGRLAT